MKTSEREKTFYMFSAGGMSQLEAGDLGPSFEGDPYRPVVCGTYPSIIADIQLYKGQEFVHNVSLKDSLAKGRVVGFRGRAKDMRRWVRNLNRSEKSYGKKRRMEKFEITDRSSEPIQAVIYYLKSPETKYGKDGELNPIPNPLQEDDVVLKFS
jgi:hypothetical protein